MIREQGRKENQSIRRGFMMGALSGVLAGATAMFVLDPQNGRRRRALARDKVIRARNTLDRSVTEDLPRRLEYFAGFAEGAKHQLQVLASGGSDRRPENEHVLVDRVMSTVFRDPELPKGDVNIDAEGTTVFLRGSVDSDNLAQDIEQRVKAVEGVDNVVNLINQPDADPSVERA